MASRQVLKKVIPVEDAISVLHDGDVLATSGYGGHGMPEQLLVALAQRFRETGGPRGLTLVHATGQGDAKDKGLNLLAHEGLLRRVIGGDFGLAPKIGQLILDEKVSRFTNSGFLRLKLGQELERRSASARVFETRADAERHRMPE